MIAETPVASRTMIKVVAGDRNYIIHPDNYADILSQVTDEQAKIYGGDDSAVLRFHKKPKSRIVNYLYRRALFIYFDKKIAGLTVRTMLRSTTGEKDVDVVEREFLRSSSHILVK